MRVDAQRDPHIAMAGPLLGGPGVNLPVIIAVMFAWRSRWGVVPFGSSARRTSPAK